MPSIVVLDHPQADIDGVQVIQVLRRDCPETKLLVLASATENEDLMVSVEAGVAGYISRDMDPQGLVLAIKRVDAGEALFPPELLLKLLKRAPDTSSRSEEPMLTNPLTAREREVLQELATGLSMLELSERLNITLHTVRTHLKNIMLKLHARSKLDAVLRALKQGLIVLPS